MWPFLVLMVSRIQPPFISCCVQHGWHLPIFVFSFTRYMIPHISLSEDFSRNLLYSWGFHLMIWSQKFPYGYPNLSEDIDWNFRAIWAWGYVSIFLLVLYIALGQSFTWTELYLWWSRGIVLRPLFTFQKWDPKLSDGKIRHFKQCPGTSYPCLIFLSYIDEDGLWGISSPLSNRISFCIRLYSFIGWGGETKI